MIGPLKGHAFVSVLLPLGEVLRIPFVSTPRAKEMTTHKMKIAQARLLPPTPPTIVRPECTSVPGFLGQQLCSVTAAIHSMITTSTTIFLTHGSRGLPILSKRPKCTISAQKVGTCRESSRTLSSQSLSRAIIEGKMELSKVTRRRRL
jgi:hypothetical protein